MMINVEHLMKAAGGKNIEVTVTKCSGRAAYKTKGGQIEADEYIEHDYGTKQGIARAYIHYPSGGENALERSFEQLRLLAGKLASGS